MDLNTIVSVVRPRHRAELAEYAGGDAWLAGGTYLFSEPQPQLRRLLDLTDLAWEPLVASEQGLSIAATCKVATLDAFEPPLEWSAAGLIGQCCQAFLASFKIWNMATVGGNICLALPAGPMISLTAALEGVCVIWTREGERRASVVDFVKGPQSNVLHPGEVLRRCCHTNLIPAARCLEGPLASGRGGGSPRPERFVSEDTKRAAGCEMALDVESVLDGGMSGQEALS